MQIKEEDLKNMINRINKELGYPEKPYTRIGENTHSQPNNIHLDFAYGGISVEQICEDGHGVQKVLHGYHTKKEVYLFLQGIMAGFLLMKQIKYQKE